ncbi:MAG: alpha/beta hydrolase [Actinomycetota bacterium]
MYLRGTEDGTLFPKDRCVVTSDGAHVAYTIKGQKSPVVVLCAGLVCPDNFWKYLVPSLQRHYSVLVWNYRGSGASGMPTAPGFRTRNYTADDFAVELYADDLREILDREGISEVVVLGHSMGTQVALEAYRLMPDRVRAIVSVAGPFGAPLDSFYNTRLSSELFPLISFAISHTPGLGPVWRALLRSPIVHPIALAVRALGPATKEEDMKPYYDHLASLDPLVVVKMAEAAHAHSAEDLLRHIDVPTLVVVGEKDNFTPPWVGHVMASRIPVAELCVVPEGTHTTLIEYPKVVNRAVLDFLRRHLGETQGAVSLTARRRARARRSSTDAATPRP